MDAAEKAKDVHDLLSQAWLLAYGAEKESTGEEKEIFDRIGMAINTAICACYPGLKK